MSEFSEYLLNKYKGKLPKDYILAIAELAENHTNRRFLNDSYFHAQLLIECMIGRATVADETRIYSGALKAECYKEILNAGSQKVRILVDDFDAAQETIKALNQQNGRITILPVATKGNNHFFTMGDSFRYELDDGKAAAVANFNEPDMVAKLNARFEAMWKAAEVIKSKKELAQPVTA